MSYVADTTVLSNFSGIGRLDLLKHLYGTLYLSTEVHAEVRAGLAAGYRFYEALESALRAPALNGWLCLTSLSAATELRTYADLSRDLDPGEASSLAIAQHRAWTLLTDDRAARRLGALRGVALSGSIGCLVRAVELGLCTRLDANTSLDEMIRRGYYSPVADIGPLINE